MGSRGVHRLVFRNTSTDTCISIGDNVAYPKGMLSLSEDEARQPHVQRMCRQGMLKYVRSTEHYDHNTELVSFYSGSMDCDKIVISRYNALGDVLITTAFLAALRAAYDTVPIVFATSDRAEPLVRYNKNASIVTGGQLRDHLADAGMYLQLEDMIERYEYSSAPYLSRNRIEILCDIVGIEPVTLCPEYYMTDDEIRGSDGIIRGYKSPRVGLCPSSLKREKMWPLENWQSLAHRLVAAGCTVFIYDKSQSINCSLPGVVPVYNMDLRHAAMIAYGMDIMVTQDSLWCHLSAALHIPQVLLAGVTDGQLIVKGYPNAVVIQRDWECCPCWYGVVRQGCNRDCYTGCMTDIGVDEVLDTVTGRIRAELWAGEEVTELT